MDRREYVSLFEAMHPGFFERPGIEAMDEEEVFDEMMLDLRRFDLRTFDLRKFDLGKLCGHRYGGRLDGGVSFGYYEGDIEALRAIVAQVDEDWTRYFDEEARVFCGFVEGEVVSFCMIEDMGTFLVDDSDGSNGGEMIKGSREVRIGGPGCVGTLPAFRDRGIGLTMVSRATQILKDEGFDYSYIHYTYLPQWYRKLGYETVLRWNRHGLLP